MGKHKHAVAVRVCAYSAAAFAMFVAGVNVAVMYPNPAYTATWFKVATGFAFYVFFLIIANMSAKAAGDRHG